MKIKKMKKLTVTLVLTLSAISSIAQVGIKEITKSQADTAMETR